VSPSRTRHRASAAWEGREVIRVATLPGHGPYARHLSHPEGVDGVHRTTVLPLGLDRAPGRANRAPAGSVPGRAPSPVFDPSWLGRHIAELDVVHVLGLPPGRGERAVCATGAAVEAVRRAGIPLVVTAYHLSDPTGPDDDTFADRLAHLLGAADAVLTLTESAADELAERWQIEATVLPHPHAVDFVRMRMPRPAGRPGPRTLVVGAHLASLRLPVDPVDFVDALTRAVAQTPDAVLRVHLNPAVTDPGARAYAPRTVSRIEALVTAVAGTLVFRRPLGEGQLWDQLTALDVSVLPPVFGSHSVWPEACADLGTRAVLPVTSHAAHQGDAVIRYQPEPDVDAMATQLARALGQARDDGGVRSDPARRWQERVQLCERHRDLFDTLLARG